MKQTQNTKLRAQIDFAVLIAIFTFFVLPGCNNSNPKLSLSYSPSNATIKIDSFSPKQYQSPHTFEFFQPGRYHLDISAPGYVPVSMIVEVKEGQNISQTVHLIKVNDSLMSPNDIPANPPKNTPSSKIDTSAPTTPVSNQSFELHAESTPPGAFVTVRTAGLNSVIVLGKAPAKQILSKNAVWLVRFELEGFETIEKTVISPANSKVVHVNEIMKKTSSPHPDAPRFSISNSHPISQQTPLPPKEPTLGFLSVTTNPWTVVSVDGKQIGNTPIVNHPLSPGAHKVLMEHRDLGKRKVHLITVAPGKHIRLDQEL